MRRHGVSRTQAWTLALMATIAFVAYLLSGYLAGITLFAGNYLAFHLLMEITMMLVCLMTFAVGWETHKNIESPAVTLLSVSTLATAVLNLLHSLSYAGMPDFVTASGPNKAIYFYFATRITLLIALLLVPWVGRVKTSRWLSGPVILMCAGLWVGTWAVAVLFFPTLLPMMFVDGQGLTFLKIYIEVAIVLLYIGAGLQFIFVDPRFGRDAAALSLYNLASASIAAALSGFFFMLYRSVFDIYNVLGHVFQVVALYHLYRGIFQRCVSTPYQEMRDFARQARSASEMKTQFLANASHDFRTPLAVVTGIADLLMSSKNLNPQERNWLEIAKRNAEQMGCLIDDLLDLTKVEHGRMRIHKTWYGARGIVDDVVMGLKPVAEKRGIQIKSAFSSSVPRSVLTDPVRLKQILNNLIGNAVKFTVHGAVEVEVDFEPSDNQGTSGSLCFSVRDTGVGIPENQVAKLFKPFSQADQVMTRGLRGTGLGLVLSKNIANLLGGDVWLKETEAGKGSTFCFRVAVDCSPERLEMTSEPTDLSQNADASSVLEAKSIEGRHVLLVDDSDDARLLLAWQLETAGAVVEQATNGREAVEKVMNGKFELILMDVRMPELDGDEAAKIMRERGVTIPIVALTGNTLEDERRKTMESGFNCYLVKPIPQAALLKTVLTYLENGEADGTKKSAS